MQVTVRILVENTTMKPGLKAEYGFSALINVDGKKYLYDTGLKDALLHNADEMHLSLESCEGIIISHGHFDHTGAVIPAIKRWGIRKLYAHSNLFADRYGVNPDQSLRYNGCVFHPEELQEAGTTWIHTDSFTEIAENIYVTGQIPRVVPYEDTGGNFVLKKEGTVLPDLLEDDMGMVIRHPKGLILISGCAHAGCLNMIRYAMEKTGVHTILAFIGGTHLMTAHQERLEKTITELKRMDIRHLMPAHCTGFYASSRLLQALGSEIVQKAETGDVFVFQ